MGRHFHASTKACTYMAPRPSCGNSFPDSEIDFELLLLQEHTPVHKEKSANYQQTEDGDRDSLPGKCAVHEILQACYSVLPRKDHHGVAHKFTAKERRNGSHGFDFRN